MIEEVDVEAVAAWEVVMIREEVEVGSLNPRPVFGSVGDSWIVRGLGIEESEVDDGKIDWLR